MQKFLLASLTLLLLTSCGATPTPEPLTQSGAPAPIVAQAPDKTIAAVNPKIQEDPFFRSCIAQTVQTCEIQSILQKSDLKDVSLCDQMSSEANKSVCRTTLLSREAADKKDESKCESLTDGKKSCISGVRMAKAIATGDAKICESLITEQKNPVTNQIFRLTQEFDICELQVVQAKAKSDVDINLCDGLKNKNNIPNCRQSLQMKFAAMKFANQAPAQAQK